MIVRFGEFELDMAKHELRHAGEPQAIEPMVFQLLSFLVTNNNRLLSREEIIESLWHGRVVSDSALSSQIKAARKAIGDSGKRQSLIKTVHGRGFRFVGDIKTDVSALQQRGPTTGPHPSDFDQEIRFCTARDGVRIAYALSGKGPPLVKAANWMSHLDFEWESPIWRHWIAGLSRRHQLVRYDERGNGMSDRDATDISFDAMVSDLETVVDTLELDRFPLFGISQGCAVSVEYARRHPGRVSCLILYGGFPIGWRKGGDDVEIRQRKALRTLMRTGWGQDNPAFRQVFTSRFVPEATPEQMDWFNELQRMTVTPEKATGFFDVFGDIDVTDRLGGVSHPTLVLHARNDGEIPFKNGRHFATGIPNAKFVSLDSHNHILLEHEPAFSRFLEEVNRFLDETG